MNIIVLTDWHVNRPTDYLKPSHASRPRKAGLHVERRCLRNIVRWLLKVMIGDSSICKMLLLWDNLHGRHANPRVQNRFSVNFDRRPIMLDADSNRMLCQQSLLRTSFTSRSTVRNDVGGSTLFVSDFLDGCARFKCHNFLEPDEETSCIYSPLWPLAVK